MSVQWTRVSARAGAIAVALVLAMAAGCASHGAIHGVRPESGKKAQARRQMLFGWWVEREPIVGAGTRIEIALRCPDGVYFFDFRTLDRHGKLAGEQQEAGDWGISGPVYFTITRAVYTPGHSYRTDMTDSEYYDAYRIQKLSYDEFRYRDYENGDEFAAHRALPAELSALQQMPGVMELPSGCGNNAGGDSGG